ncbi:SUKH-4 family immunity protein [Nonomuraea sp. 3N208]|uniref:SUKH-4 family immunity protein n=1 Tax=Nonomuraea sp. 3N208 TaxID=3457421 RepID=UPI003FCD2969
MLTRNDLVQWCGAGGVVQASAAIVSRWSIPHADRDILLEVGLPRAVEPFFETRLQEGEAPALLAGRGRQLYGIGWDLGNEIGIAEDGRIYAVNADEPPLFVNSSLIAFVESLHECGKARAAYPAMTDDEIDSDVARLLGQLRAIDPAAFAKDGDGWWSLVFEQMAASLL